MEKCQIVRIKQVNCPVYDCLRKRDALRRTELLQEVRKVQFEQVLEIWAGQNKA